MFVEITEKKQFPVLGFSGGSNWRLAEPKEGSRRKNCASEDQELAVCDMLSPIREPKWKSWLDGLLPDWVLRGLPNGQRVGVGNSERSVERQDEGHVYKIGIQAAHEHEPGRVVRLDFGEESDGTRRLLNLISALYRASATERSTPSTK